MIEAPSPHAQAGQVTRGIVSLSLCGGLLAGLTICWSADFQKAMHLSPLFLAWAMVITGDGILAWSMLLPAGRIIQQLWPGVSAEVRQQLRSTLIFIAAMLGAFFTLMPMEFPLEVTWPLGHHHGIRLGAVSALILIPALVAVLVMWLAAAKAECLPRSADNPVEVVAEYLEQRRTVQGFLWFVGAVIGGTVLATGAMRKAMLAAQYATGAHYPSELVVAYGAFFTLILGLCYLPAYLLMQRAGDRILHDFLKGTTDVAAWNKERKRLAKLLGLDASIAQSLKDLGAIVSPLAAGLFSIALPDLAAK